jgi:hypothetical protein
MNAKTALIMFAVLAAFGLVAATLVVPIVPQAHAQGCLAKSSECKGHGIAIAQAHGANPPGPP